MCADLRDVWAKFVGVTERNVFCKNRPHGGARPGLSRKFEAEVHCWHPRSVCAKFRSNRTSGAGDYAFTDGLTHTRTDGRGAKQSLPMPSAWWRQISDLQALNVLCCDVLCACTSALFGFRLRVINAKGQPL